jgi:hypothetical protein
MNAQWLQSLAIPTYRCLSKLLPACRTSKQQARECLPFRALVRAYSVRLPRVGRRLETLLPFLKGSFVGLAVAAQQQVPFFAMPQIVTSGVKPLPDVDEPDPEAEVVSSPSKEYCLTFLFLRNQSRLWLGLHQNLSVRNARASTMTPAVSFASRTPSLAPPVYCSRLMALRRCWSQLRLIAA